MCCRPPFQTRPGADRAHHLLVDLLRDVVPNHFVSANVDEYPSGFHPYRDQLEGRSMLVRRAKMIEVECVARGYVAGSA